MKTLSSSQTFIMKIIFPVVWISAFGLGTLAIWGETTQMKGGGSPPPEMKWQFLGAWIAGTAFILWGCAGLKRVRTDSENLYISNYRREISVPMTMISDVTENRWINIHPVTVHFRTAIEFGQSITFMPTTRMFGFFSSHPVVPELKQLAGLPPS